MSWNRIREGGKAADAFEAAGRPVLITENASWANDFQGGSWLTLAHGYHNMAGQFPVGGPERWDDLNVDLQPWRTEGETVVLPQRGIGPPEVRMPSTWPHTVKGRVRNHPGRFPPAKSLADDMAGTGRVITWGSGAAVLALMWGIPVESHMPRWIAEQENTDAGRLAMFQRLAWAQWRLSEFRSGEAFEWMLQ